MHHVSSRWQSRRTTQSWSTQWRSRWLCLYRHASRLVWRRSTFWHSVPRTCSPTDSSTRRSPSWHRCLRRWPTRFCAFCFVVNCMTYQFRGGYAVELVSLSVCLCVCMFNWITETVMDGFWWIFCVDRQRDMRDNWCWSSLISLRSVPRWHFGTLAEMTSAACRVRETYEQPSLTWNDVRKSKTVKQKPNVVVSIVVVSIVVLSIVVVVSVSVVVSVVVVVVVVIVY